MNERSNLFEVLEPPPGGLAGLRARLDGEGRRTGKLRLLRAVAVAALVIATVNLTLWAPWERRDAPEMDFALARMSLGLRPLPAQPVTVPEESRAEMAARRIPLETDRVIFYLVASRVPADPEAQVQ